MLGATRRRAPVPAAEAPNSTIGIPATTTTIVEQAMATTTTMMAASQQAATPRAAAAAGTPRRVQHGHSHRTGDATRYWRDAKGLSVTLIVFLLVAMTVNTNYLFGSREKTTPDPRDWTPHLTSHPLALFKNLSSLGAGGFFEKHLYMGPNLLQHMPRAKGKRSPSDLVLVLPFVASQIEKIQHQWSSWKMFPPCTEPKKKEEEKTVMLLHFDLDIKDFPEVEAKLRRMWTDSMPESVRSCFSSNSPKFFSSNVPPELNSHAYGSAVQFFNLFYHLHKANEVTHWFQMEPDVTPIRENWLTRIEKDASENKKCQNFWQRGSISYCRGEEASPVGLGRVDTHINGNSLYCVTDPAVMEFLGRVLAFNNGHAMFNIKRARPAWDQVLSEYLLEPTAQQYTATIAHKFQYTEFIQNLCEQPYNPSDLIAKFPGVYLVALANALRELDARALRGNEEARYMAKLEDDSYLLSLFPGLSVSSLTLLDKAKWILCEQWLIVNGPGPKWSNTINEVTQKQCERAICWNAPFSTLPPSMPVETSLLKSGAKTFPVMVREFCRDVIKSENYAQLVPQKSIYVWSTDLHASPIACSKGLLESIGATVHAEIDFGNCIYSHLCKERLKVLENDNWKAFSNDNTCPPKVVRDFYSAYQNDREMKRVDAVICSHPVANCELYMALNRSLIIYATTRLEFGRNDDSIDWRQPYMHALSPARGVAWLDSLKRISDNPFNSILANNQYDVHYIKYFTGIDAEYLPSWCDPPVTWKSPPANPSILLGPYRDNLDFPRFDEDEAWKHPIMTSLLEAATKAGNKHEFKRMRQLYPNYTPEQILSHQAIVWIPYQVSTMSWFEFYRMNIPIFAPSLDLLIQWIKDHHIVWERIYGHPKERIPFKVSGGLVDVPIFDPNMDTSDESLRYWLKFCDFYQHDTFPGIQLFDSWDHLMSLLNNINFESISLEMKLHNEREKDRIRFAWKRLLRRAVLGGRMETVTLDVRENVGMKTLPSTSYETALEQIYRIPPEPRPQDHALCAGYYAMRKTKQFETPRYPLQEVRAIPFVPPTIGDCHPNIPAGIGACNIYCPGWYGVYRSDLRACVGGMCDLLTEEACKDEWLHEQCSEYCETFFTGKREKLIQSTTIIACLTLFGLGGVLGIMFARSQYPLPEDSDDDDDDDVHQTN